MAVRLGPPACSNGTTMHRVAIVVILALVAAADREPAKCLCGKVISGLVTPDQCELFGSTCTPINPIGPCMVSSEGTCQAWFKYKRPRAVRSGSRVELRVTA